MIAKYHPLNKNLSVFLEGTPDGPCSLSFIRGWGGGGNVFGHG